MTITVRVPEEKKEDFREIADAMGVSMQAIIEEYIQRVIEHEDEILETVTPVFEQMNEVIGVFGEVDQR